MENTIDIAKESGLVGRVLHYFGINTYYPASVTEFVRERGRVRLTYRVFPLGWIYNGKALVKLNSCFYSPFDDGISTLGDLGAMLKIDIEGFRGDLPQSRMHVRNVLLELREGRELPRLIKYG